MVNYDDFLDELVTQLTTLSGLGVDVLKLPEIESEYKRPSTVPRVIISYLGSDFEAQRSTNEVIQDELITVGVEISFKKLYGSLGVYDIQNKIISLLQGFTPTNCNHGLKIRNFRYASQPFDSGFWTLQLEFYTDTPISESFDLIDGPELQQIDFNLTITT